MKFVRPGCRAQQRSFTTAHLIADFLFLQKKLGKRPSVNEYLYHCHTPKVLDRAFGKPGWKRLIKAVGKKALADNKVNKEHLIQDYLDTVHAVGREPRHSDFYERHRHSINVFVRVFGKPGWKNLRKAAAFAKRKPGACSGFACVRPVRISKPAKPARTEKTILKELRTICRALLKAHHAGKKKRPSEKSLENARRLRSRINDLFVEAGRVISLEEALRRIAPGEKVKAQL